MEQERVLLDIYQSSPGWEQFWFRHARETTLLQIIGDIALYVSPYVAAKIVDRLHKVIIRLQHEQQVLQEGGRLHLISHSLGTIILFDILFASRWDREDVPGYNCILEIREALSGLGTNPEEGIRIASVHTMGSPLALFSLINMHAERQEKGESLHDIAPRLQQFLEHLSHNRRGKLLPWWNFSHPGDPFAYPLEKLLGTLIDHKRQYLEVHDAIILPHNLEDLVTERFSQSPVALIDARAAHHCYWNSKQVAHKIAQTMKEIATLDAQQSYV
jgi:hypothetical protein